MSRFKSSILTIVGLLAAGSLGLAYTTSRIGLDTLVFVAIVMLALGFISVFFIRKMRHPDMSVEQMLYKTDHPTQT